MSYSEKLKSPKWQKKRLQILERDEFSCNLCGDDTTELHVHHERYVGQMPWDTPDKYLNTLCKNCHFVCEQLKANYKICGISRGVKENGEYYIVFVILKASKQEGVAYFLLENERFMLQSVISSEVISLLHQELIERGTFTD
jgi:hypothetical protein